MNVDVTSILTFLGLSGGAGGAVSLAVIKLFIKEEAKKALKDEIETLQKQIENLNNLKTNKETCFATHLGLDGRFDRLEQQLSSINQTQQDIMKILIEFKEN